MPTTCTKCNINWERLWDQEDDYRDETYYFCPVCKSDRSLVEKKNNSSSYIRCRITGKIKNAKTGEIIKLKRDTKEKKPKKKRRYKIWTETEEDFYERRQAEQDYWVERYQFYLETMPSEIASVMSNEGRQKVERKFVWSDEIEQSDLKTI